jgi:uncharacterized protein (TIGR03067 family)
MNSMLILAVVLAAPGPKEAPKKGPAYVGEWVTETITLGGQQIPVPAMTVRIAADGTMERRGPDGKAVVTGTFTVDLKPDPPYLDITVLDDKKVGRVAKGIFKIDGDQLTLCTSQDDSRPTAFASPAGSHTVLMVLKRKKD